MGGKEKGRRRKSAIEKETYTRNITLMVEKFIFPERRGKKMPNISMQYIYLYRYYRKYVIFICYNQERRTVLS